MGLSIDMEKVTHKEHVKKALEEAIPFVESRGYGGVASIMYDSLELLKEQEVKTGYWIDSAGNDKCSNCGMEYSDLYPDYSNTHFCPNCGAKMTDTIAVLKEQEARELTMDEWREWKSNPKRNPICKLWEHDTSPIWILNPNEVHEPALLMGKLKLFTGKPTFEQCKKVKWE